jgi:predicted ABC-type ATPase
MNTCSMASARRIPAFQDRYPVAFHSIGTANTAYEAHEKGAPITGEMLLQAFLTNAVFGYPGGRSKVGARAVEKALAKVHSENTPGIPQGPRAKLAEERGSISESTKTPEAKSPEAKAAESPVDVAQVRKDYFDQSFAGKMPAREMGEKQVLTLTGGPPGIGKTEAFESLPGINAQNTIHVDVDALKAFAKQTGRSRDDAFHEDASKITKELLDKSIDGGYHTNYDSQMANFSTVNNAIQKVLANDGIVNIFFIHGDAATSKARTIARALKGEAERLPPDDAILKGVNQGLPTFLELFKRYKDNPNVRFSLTDNNVDFRTPIRVFKKDSNGLQILNKDLFDTLMKSEYVSQEGGSKYVRSEPTTGEDLRANSGEIERRVQSLVGKSRSDVRSHVGGDAESPSSPQKEGSVNDAVQHLTQSPADFKSPNNKSTPSNSGVPPSRRKPGSSKRLEEPE